MSDAIPQVERLRTVRYQISREMARGLLPPGQSMSQESRYYWLTYPTKRVTRPVIGEMKKKFALTTRIRSATITEEFGQIALELTGEQKVIGAAVRWFRRQGVQVDHLALGGT